MLIRTHPYMTVLYSTREATLHDLTSRKPTEAGASLRASPLADGKGEVLGLPGFATFHPASPGRFNGTAVKELYQYVADLDLLVCGPQYWFYHEVDGKPQTRFTLEVALPVQGKIPTAVLPFFKRLPAFRCLSSRYEGPREGIGAEYQRMLQYVADNGLKLNGIYAESFLHIDFDDPANQITEILIGLSD